MTPLASEKYNPTAHTFVVKVLRQEHSSWQGTVQWINGKKEQCFRSTLELLRLMDEALQHAEDEGECERRPQHDQ